MQLLLSWLAMPPGSVQSHLVRAVFTRLDWHFGVLPSSLHVAVAIAITEVESKLSVSEGTGMVATGAGSVTDLVTSNPSHQFTTWAWETLSRLHLHMMDREEQEARGMMNGNAATHGSTLDYYLNSQVEEVVAAAVSKHPLAAYTAILLTQVFSSARQHFHQHCVFDKFGNCPHERLVETRTPQMHSQQHKQHKSGPAGVSTKRICF